MMLRASTVVELHGRWTAAWHLEQPIEESLAREFGVDSVEGLLARQHLANFELWHQEDRAREPDVNDATIAAVKRAIDRTNQRRHDVTESMDCLLLDIVGRQGNLQEGAPLHSETPGMMTDRLSILALKIFHTEQELTREDAPAGHAERNAGRMALLTQQQADLAGCLESLWDDATAGRRRFKLYRQLKMYNDPALNPVIYKSNRNGGDGA